MDLVPRVERDLLRRVPLFASRWVYAPRMDGQVRLEDDVFELREPLQRDSHFSIDVTQDGRTKEWRVRLSTGAFSGSSRTLAEALHQMANRIDAAKVFGSETFDKQELTGKRLRCCDYCGQPIFFALTPNEKWLPVDGTSVDGKDIGDLRCFLVADNAGKPAVQWLSKSKARGQVWIAHPDVCGTNETEPSSPVLKERWLENRERVVVRQQEAVRGLQNLVTEMEN